MNFLVLLLAGLLAVISLLTVVRAPGWMWAWKLAILVGEFGHWFALVALAVLVLAWAGPAGVARDAAMGLGGVAFVLLLRPAIMARRVAARLPAELAGNFGGSDEAVSALSLRRLFGPTRFAAAAGLTEVFARPDGQELKIDFYPAAAGHGRSPPCLVVIHGGGWDGGDCRQLAWWNRRWAARGYAVAALSYRLAPRWTWPAQREDVHAALAWLKAHAGRLGVDASRLVLLGRSAGGQLATAVGYGARDPAIRGVVALYAPHDMPFMWTVVREDDALNSTKLTLQYFGGAYEGGRRAVYESASGQLLAQPDSPATLLVHGALDTLSWERHSERLAARLGELGVPHYYLRLPWATHGFDFNPDGPGGQLADYAIGRFLARVTR